MTPDQIAMIESLHQIRDALAAFLLPVIEADKADKAEIVIVAQPYVDPGFVPVFW